MAPIDVDDDTKNWLKVGLALKHLKNGLLPFVRHHISILHTAIINNNGTCNTCTTENVLQCPTNGMCKFKHKRCQYHDQADPQKQTRLCPNGVCEKVSGEIENNHIWRPNWKNTDATKWASDPWEIAKCFLPPGYAGCQSALETDCTAILSLCLNCRPLEAAITPVKALVEKNRTNRNQLMHSGRQELTTTDRGVYIQDAINLLTQYQTPINPNTQKCIDILTELNTDGIILTTDDISDVIKDAIKEIRQQQELIKSELASERADVEENKDSIEKLQAGKVDQETYMMKVMELDQSLKAMDSKVQHIDASAQKEVRKQMEAIRKGTESMKTDISKHIETLDEEVKQLRRLLKSEVKKRKHTDKELDEVKSKVAKHEEKVTSHEMEIDDVKSGMAELECKVETIQVKMAVDTLTIEDQKVQTKQNRKLDGQSCGNNERGLRDHLVNVYKKTCSKMPVAPPKRNMLADIREHYRRQEMKQVEMPHEPKGNQGDRDNIGKKCEQTGDQKAPKLTFVNFYHDIFHRKGKKCRNIYIKGEAGSGKSVFCQNMVNMWCSTIPSDVKDSARTDDQASTSYHEMDPNEVQSRPNRDDYEIQSITSRQDDSQSEVQSISSCEDDEDQDQVDEMNESLLQQIEFLFYLQLRYAAEHKDIFQMIKHILLMDNDDLAYVLTDVLKNKPEKCLVLLDGLDEWAPPKGAKSAPYVTRGLPERDIMINWTVLTTTRPWKLELVRPESEEMDQLIELSGLTQYSAEECIVSVVQYLNDRFHEDKSVKHCRRDLSTAELRHFMTLPVLLKQLVCIWFDEGQVGHSQCDIYAGMIDVFLRYSSQRQESPDSLTHSPSDTSKYNLPSCLNKRDSCKKYISQLYPLSKLAFYTLFCRDRESSLVFNSTRTEFYGMSKAETDMWLNVGLLSQDISDRGSAEDQKQLSFPHKSIQEFLAAVYISVCFDDNTKQISDICTSVEMVMEMSQVFLFVAGMKPIAFNKISEHIAEVVNRNTHVQEYRTSTKGNKYHIKTIQDLMLKCIEESNANHHSDIAVHIQDIILQQTDVTNNSSDVVKTQVDLARMNKAHVASLTIFRTSTSHHANKSNVRYIFERHWTMIERVPLTYVGSETDIFTQFTHLYAICFAGIKLNYHQVNHILAQNTELKAITMARVHISPCTDRCDNCCKYHIDMSQNTRLQHIELNDLRIAERDAGAIEQVMPVSNEQCVPCSTLMVNATQLETCTISRILDDNTEHIQQTVFAVECIGTTSKCTNFNLGQFSLHHDQMLKVITFVSKTKCLKHITLSELKCADCDKLCKMALDLSEHTMLETLVINEQHVRPIYDFNYCFNELRVNTKQLQTCIVDNTKLKANGELSTIEFIGTAQHFRNIKLKHITLKHAHFEELMSFLTRAGRLREITLHHLRCVDHGNACECRLDFTAHTALKKLTLDSVHVIGPQVTLNTSGILNLSHYDKDTSDSVKLNNLHTDVLQLDTSILTIYMLHVNDLKVNTARLVKCTITRVSSTESEPRQHDSALSAFEFIGTAQRLTLLNLSNIALTQDQLQGLMSFLTRTTCLKEIALSQLKCDDHSNTCEYQLDFAEHTLRRVQLDRLHVDVLKVNTTHLKECTITGVSENDSESRQHDSAMSTFDLIGTAQRLTSLNLSNIDLTHDQFQGVMSFVTRTTCLEEITLSQLKCVDHGNTCECQLDLTAHTFIEKLKLDSVYVTILRISIITDDQGSDGVSLYNLHTNVIHGQEMENVILNNIHTHVLQVDTDSLRFHRIRVNDLHVNTTRLVACTITNVSSNDSESRQHDSAMSKFEFIGTAQRLASLNLSKITLKHDQFQGVMSFVTRTTSLREITLSQLRCVDHGNTCTCQLDLTEQTFIEKLKLESVYVTILRVTINTDGQESDRVNLYNLHTNVLHIDTDRLRFDRIRVNDLHVNTTRLVACTITDVSSNGSEPGQHDSALSTFEFIGTAQRLKSLNLSNIVLTHDQLQGLMAFVMRSTSLNEIHLSQLRCVVHGNTCEYQLDLTAHTLLQKLNVYNVHMNNLKITTNTDMNVDRSCYTRHESNRVNLYNIHTNVLQIDTDSLRLNRIRVNDLHVNTTRLVECTITDVSSNDSEPGQHDSALSTFEFIGTAQRLKSLNLSKIALTHDQLQALMSFLTRTTCLKEIALSQLKCVEHGNTCECQLDLTKHTLLQKLKLYSVYVAILRVTINTDDQKSDRVNLYNVHTNVLHSLETGRAILNNIHTNVLHGQETEQVVVNNIHIDVRYALETEQVILNNIHTNVLQIDSDRLIFNRIRVNDLHVNTTRLVACTITDVSSNGSEPRQHDSALSTFEFIGTAQRLTILNLSNIALTHDQFQGLMLFVTRTTRLKEITLSQLRCVEHGNTCECQLDLTEQTFIQNLKVYDVNVNNFKVTTNTNMNTNNSCITRHESDRVNLHNEHTNVLHGQETERVILNNIQTHVLQIDTDRLKLNRIRVNDLHVNTTRLVACTITDVSSNGSEPGQHDSAMSTFKFIRPAQHLTLLNHSNMALKYPLSTFEFTGTAQHLKSLNLSNIPLNHDQLKGLMSFVTRTTSLEKITLSQLRCVEHGNTCECQLDLTAQTLLQKLKVYDVYVNILKVTTNTNMNTNNSCITRHESDRVNLHNEHTNVLHGQETERVILNNIQTHVLQIDTDRLKLNRIRVNDLHVNTTRLVTCTITDVSSNDSEPDQHDSAMSTFEFIGTAQSLTLLNLSNIPLTHDQLQGLMSFLTRTTSLKEITLSQLRCVEHGNTCEFQLDLTAHTLLQNLNVYYVHMNILKVTTNTNMNTDTYCITSHESDRVNFNNIRTNDLQIETDRLRFEKIRVNDLHVNTTRLVACTITDVSSNDSKSDQHDSALFTFEFIGTAQHLTLLNLSNIVLTNHQLHGFMAFVTRTTCLEEVALSQLKCVENDNACEYQLDLAEHTPRRLQLDRLHVDVLKVNTTHLKECTITGVSANDSESRQHDSAMSTFDFIGTAKRLTLLNVSDIALTHAQFQALMLFVTRTTCLKEITLSQLRCVEHGNTCEFQLDLTAHTAICNLKLGSIHVNVLKVVTLSQFNVIYQYYGNMESVDCVKLHANTVQIDTRRLKLDRLHVNELEVNTKWLKYCAITDVSLNDSEPGQKDCAMSTFEFIGTAQKLQHLQLRNINLRHGHFEKIMSFLTETTCLRKIILSELMCVDHRDHGNACECQLNLMNHKQLQKLEIDNLHVNEVEVNASRLKCCRLTNMRSAVINLIPCDFPTSVDLSVDNGKCCEWLVVGNVHLTNEQLDKMREFVTHTKGRCVVSLYEIECSECDEECSRIANLQQLVQFGQPDDEDADSSDSGDNGDSGSDDCGDIGDIWDSGDNGDNGDRWW